MKINVDLVKKLNRAEREYKVALEHLAYHLIEFDKCKLEVSELKDRLDTLRMEYDRQELTK